MGKKSRRQKKDPHGASKAPHDTSALKGPNGVQLSAVRILNAAGDQIEGDPQDLATTYEQAIGQHFSQGFMDAVKKVLPNVVDNGASAPTMATRSTNAHSVPRPAREPVTGAGCAPLWAASANGHHETVQLLLRRGAAMRAVNDLGQSALWIAACNGHIKVVESMLTAIAEDHSNASVLDLSTHSGTTPLIAAAVNGHIRLAAALFKGGARSFCGAHGCLKCKLYFKQILQYIKAEEEENNARQRHKEELVARKTRLHKEMERLKKEKERLKERERVLRREKKRLQDKEQQEQVKLSQLEKQQKSSKKKKKGKARSATPPHQLADGKHNNKQSPQSPSGELRASSTVEDSPTRNDRSTKSQSGRTPPPTTTGRPSPTGAKDDTAKRGGSDAKHKGQDAKRNGQDAKRNGQDAKRVGTDAKRGGANATPESPQQSLDDLSATSTQATTKKKSKTYDEFPEVEFYDDEDDDYEEVDFETMLQQCKQDFQDKYGRTTPSCT